MAELDIVSRSVFQLRVTQQNIDRMATFADPKDWPRIESLEY